MQLPRRGWYGAAATVSVTVVLLLPACAGTPDPGGSPSASATTTTATPTPTVPATTASTPTATATATTPAETPREFAYQPLWPFTSLGEVADWQTAYRESGSQPWHLDAEATASTFTTGYLGFTEVNEVVGRTIRGDEAWVSVGYTTEDVIKPYVAAEIHLVKYGSGDDAPWEVVGTRDSDFTLTTPEYGSVAASPVTAGGRITGVDESIVVEVRQRSSERPLGASKPVPAGGQNQPWSATVSYSGATDPALTLVARTGGHYRDVERFTITAIQPA